jgi:hypothetical protein
VAAVTALRLTSLTITLEYSDEDAPCFLASHFHFSGEGASQRPVPSGRALISRGALPKRRKPTKGKPEVLSSTKRCMEDRIMELEVENSRLQRLVAELLLKNQQLRDAHLPSQSDSGKFDRNQSRLHAE